MARELLRGLALITLTLTGPQGLFGQAPPATTVEFRSEAVGRNMKYNIIFPGSYARTTDHYPVLYLLHGLGGNYTNWVQLGAPEYARAYDLIVVMPDAGNSWFINWAKSEKGQRNNWEDYIIKDLIGHVDATYRTIPKREGRAINGLSMGGYGAVMLGLRHPDMFGSVGSSSGGLTFVRLSYELLKKEDRDLIQPKQLSVMPDPTIGIEGFSSQADRQPKGRLFTSPQQCAAWDPFQLVLEVPRDQLPHIYVDDGTEDSFISDAQEFLKVLMDNKIPFTYAQSMGRHVPSYWKRELRLSMAVQFAIMQRNLAKARPQ